MLNQYPFQSSKIVFLFTLICSILKTLCQNGMDVTITNSPDFFYGHRCQMIISVISQQFPAWNDYNQELFMLTLLQSNNGARFLQYFYPQYIHTNTSMLLMQYGSDMCNRGLMRSNFYCVTVLISPQIRMQYNSTFFMYKFTVPIMCPRVAIDANSYHIRLKIQVPQSVSSSNLKLSGNYTYRFVNLKYRVIDQVLINPGYTGSTNVPLAKNFLIGGPTRISFLIDIVNQTEMNNWQKFEIFFLKSLSSFSIDNSSCIVSSSPLIPLSITSMSNSTLIQSPCSYSSITNSFAFKNPNYTSSSFMQNSCFNLYDLYLISTPGVRLNFSVLLTFNIADSIQFYYQISSSTSYRIDDFGNKVGISQTNGIMYENSMNPDTIFALNLSSYQNTDSRYRAYSSIYGTPAAAAYTPTSTSSSTTNNTPSTTTTTTNSDFVKIYPTTITNATTNITSTNTSKASIVSNPTSSTSTVTFSTTPNAGTSTCSSSTTSSSSSSSTSTSTDTTATPSTPTSPSSSALSSNSFVSVLVILLLVLVSATFRKQPLMMEKYTYVIVIITDLLYKIIIIVVNNALSSSTSTVSYNSQVSFLLTAFIIIQYVGINIIVFCTYCVYIWAKKQKQLRRSQQFPDKIIKKQKSIKSTIFFLASLFVNYKLYCMCLFTLSMPRLRMPKLPNIPELIKKYKNDRKQSNKNKQANKGEVQKIKKAVQIKKQSKDKKNKQNKNKQQNDIPLPPKYTTSQMQQFRNEHLYIKYCWHIGLQILFILIQVFFVFQTCLYFPISILFSVQQGIQAVLMAVVGKYVYRLIGSRKGKKKILNILQSKKDSEKSKKKSKISPQIQQMDKQNEQYFSKVHKQLSMNTKKSGIMQQKLKQTNQIQNQLQIQPNTGRGLFFPL